MTFFEGWNALITGHEGGEVALWSVATGTNKTIGKHNSTVAGMAMGLVWVRMLACVFQNSGYSTNSIHCLHHLRDSINSLDLAGALHGKAQD